VLQYGQYLDLWYISLTGRVFDRVNVEEGISTTRVKKSIREIKVVHHRLAIVSLSLSKINRCIDITTLVTLFHDLRVADEGIGTCHHEGLKKGDYS
jgi:hypothetical protein